MSEQKVWFVTGANRGIGVETVKAALAAGHFVLATARQPATIEAAVGASENLLALPLDITDEQQPTTASRPPSRASAASTCS
jgi:NAD(P)-dependent dehydrogenase (short-subunit alcohol dehydrogenase family)